MPTRLDIAPLGSGFADGLGEVIPSPSRALGPERNGPDRRQNVELEVMAGLQQSKDRRKDHQAGAWVAFQPCGLSQSAFENVEIDFPGSIDQMLSLRSICLVIGSR